MSVWILCFSPMIDADALHSIIGRSSFAEKDFCILYVENCMFRIQTHAMTTIPNDKSMYAVLLRKKHRKGSITLFEKPVFSHNTAGMTG